MSRSPWLRKSQQRSGDLRGEGPSYSLTGDQFSPMPQVVLMPCTVRVDEADIDQINQRDFTVHRVFPQGIPSHSLQACGKYVGL